MRILTNGINLPTADYIQEKYEERFGESYWCIQGVYVGKSYFYNDF